MQKEETQINEQKGDNNTGTEQVVDIELPEEIELTQKQEKFCRLYTQNSELFGNGTLAYSEAYGYDLDSLSRANELDENGKEIRLTSEYDKAYSVCAVGASRLLRKIKIGEKITEFLNELMKDTVVDAQLAKVIMQDYKLEAKVSAIKEYNKLKQRITDIKTDGRPIIQIVNQIATKYETPQKPSDNSRG